MVLFIFPGANLDVCQTSSSSQCCMQAFLNEVKEQVTAELVEDLKEEVEDSGYVVANVTDRLATCE